MTKIVAGGKRVQILEDIANFPILFLFFFYLMNTDLLPHVLSNNAIQLKITN